jgi:glycosyltransferase involved in cell wall biosynthesis
MAHLARRRNDFTLVIAGSGERVYEAQVRQLVTMYDLHDCTIFTGFMQGEEKLQLLREADIFVLPSYHENFGVAVIEALAAGLPVVISSRVNIYREILEAGAGLVTPLESHALTTTLDGLLNNPSMRHEMGQRGKQLASTRFSWSAISGEMLRVYTTLLEAKSRS